MSHPISSCHGSPAHIAALDVIARAKRNYEHGWYRLSVDGQIAEMRAVLCSDILTQAPGREVSLEWWRAVQTAATAELCKD